MFKKKFLNIEMPEPLKVPGLKANSVIYGLQYERYSPEILCINIFKNIGGKAVRFIPFYKMYVKKNDYITYVFETEKWSSSSLSRLISCFYYAPTEVDTDVLKQFLLDMDIPHDMDSPVNFHAIWELQEDIMKQRREIKNLLERKQIDSQMQKFKQPIGPAIKKFLLKDVFKNENFLFYNKKKRTAYCTHCETEVDFKKVKQVEHNKHVTCPRCRLKVLAKAEGISHKYLYVKGTGVVFSHYKDELLIRYFDVYKDYKDFRNPKSHFSEVVRTVLSDSKSINYEWKDFHKTGENWCKCNRFMTNGYATYGIKYAAHSNFAWYGFNANAKSTPFRYSAAELFLGHSSINPTAWFYEVYLEQFQSHPVLEKLVKAGLISIAKTCMNRDFVDYDYTVHQKVPILDEEQAKLHKILKISKYQLKQLQQIDNPNIDILNLMQAAHKHSIKDQYTMDFYKFINTFNISSSRYNEVFDLISMFGAEKVSKYLKSITLCNNSLATYLDYIENCKQLNWNLRNSFVSMPKDLHKAHDEAMSLVKEKRKKEQIDAINNLLPKMAEKYTFQYKDLMIVVPKDALEYYEESHVLHNCISRNYIGKLAEGRSEIVFIRKISDPDTPYFAMEIEGDKILQVHGKFNCNASPDVKECVEQFKQNVLMAA